MSYTKADIEKMAKQIRYDFSVTQTRIDELMQAVASLPIPAKVSSVRCSNCGVEFNETEVGRERLKAHLENVHGEVKV